MLDVSGSDSTAGGVEWGGEVSFAGLCFLCCGDLFLLLFPLPLGDLFLFLGLSDLDLCLLLGEGERYLLLSDGADFFL